jgi:hypothetical protein
MPYSVRISAKAFKQASMKRTSPGPRSTCLTVSRSVPFDRSLSVIRKLRTGLTRALPPGQGLFYDFVIDV